MDKISPGLIGVQNPSCWEDSSPRSGPQERLVIESITSCCSSGTAAKGYGVQAAEGAVSFTSADHHHQLHIARTETMQGCASMEMGEEVDWGDQREDANCSSDAGSTPGAPSHNGDSAEVSCEAVHDLVQSGESTSAEGSATMAGSAAAVAGKIDVKDSRIQIVLEGADLWRRFHSVGTEMIITKAGRRMFPALVVSISGLDPEVKYGLTAEMSPAGNNRYKYLNSKWVVVSKGDIHNEDLLRFGHPDSPASGKHWMSSKVTFKKIKLTNNKGNKRAHVALNSMHKYTPRIIVHKFSGKKTSTIIHTQDFPECSFIAVTAYQNDQVTQLKIDHNPFAKAFRDNTMEQESNYGYQGVVNAWPPPSPVIHSYPPRDIYLTADSQPPGQFLGQGQLPGTFQHTIPQFPSTFSSWDTSYAPSQGYRYQLSTSTGGTACYTTGLPDSKLQWNMSRLATESPPVSPHMMYSPNISPMTQNLYPYNRGDSSSSSSSSSPQFLQFGGVCTNSSVSPSTPKGPYTATILNSRLQPPLQLQQPLQLQAPGVGYKPYSSNMGIKLLPSFQQLVPKSEAHP